MKSARLYKIKLHPDVIRHDSKRFDAKTKDKIKAKCLELLSKAPEEVGEPLRLELKGYRKLKIFDDYRIVYKVIRDEVVVYVLAVGIRRDSEVYADAIKRLRS
ncbi:MAG: type II toxin-antitoxin system mRNA interferase toxin, RelE/StbE family [Candidatus Omnitrophica bacterium]|nr:type II toxin-antitoxin system mRNA interferase toxin, RelE/StbE family [Candidatus Omnitrophota bacterium]